MSRAQKRHQGRDKPPNAGVKPKQAEGVNILQKFAKGTVFCISRSQGITLKKFLAQKV